MTTDYLETQEEAEVYFSDNRESFEKVADGNYPASDFAQKVLDRLDGGVKQ